MAKVISFPVPGLDQLDKIRYASRFHLSRAYAHLRCIESKKEPHDFYSIDRSFLMGKFTLLCHRNFLSEWHLESSKICSDYKLSYHRVIPLLNRVYSATEIDNIKFTLHVLLSLGCIIYLPVVNNINYLKERFGESNFVTIENEFTIKTRHIWDENNAELLIDYSKENVSLFKPYTDKQWREENLVYFIKYRRNTFTAGVNRKEPLKEYYGDFLCFLQNKRCAILGEPLNAFDFQVDHIYPASKGGTNTLINLQAVCSTANRKKSDNVIQSDRRIWDDKQLTEKGFDLYHPYPELTCRDISVNPFGYLLL
jgi:hypothetical protein